MVDFTSQTFLTLLRPGATLVFPALSKIIDEHFQKQVFMWYFWKLSVCFAWTTYVWILKIQLQVWADWSGSFLFNKQDFHFCICHNCSNTELQWLEHLLDHENMFKTGVVPARRHNKDIFSIFFKMKIFCVFSLESPYQGDSNEYTQYTIFNIKWKINLNYLKSAAMWFFPRDSSMSSKQPW